jgi:3-phosphoshikimate 1-carboxyvinyltransferase
MSGKVSSQFISGVLMAAPLALQPVTLTVVDEIVQKDYVGITMAYMAKFGVHVDADAGFMRFSVLPRHYQAASLTLEADASTTTYFTALAAVTGGRMAVTNLGTDTTQPDYGFTDILERMGCRVTRRDHSTEVVGPEQLKGDFAIDMKPLSDATLTLAAIAPFASGPIHIHGVAHIRHHERDRIGVMCRLLSSLGIKVEERPDGLSVYPGQPTRGEIDPHEDHRVAMALSLVGLKGQGVRITHPNCVSKTCPGYFDLLAGLGVAVDTIR